MWLRHLLDKGSDVQTIIVFERKPFIQCVMCLPYKSRHDGCVRVSCGVILTITSPGEVVHREGRVS